MALEKGLGGVRRFVDRAGGTTNVVEVGPDDGQVVVFVHGFPDTHAVWLPVMARLADPFRCLAYDVRGAGESTAPESTDGYRVAHLVDDLVAVIDSRAPGRPVHLVAHDWGSVQTWEAVLLAGSDPRLQGRIASYTTMSGPALGHFSAWTRSGLRGSWSQRRRVLRQLAQSWYVLAFQLPWLPERLLRRALATPDSARRFLGSGHAVRTVSDDAVNGLGLYRANAKGSDGPRHSLHTALPVQLIVALRDPFLTPAVYDGLPRWCADLTRHDLEASHWAQVSHPDEVADLVATFVSRHEGHPVPRTSPTAPSTTEHPPSVEVPDQMPESDRPAVSGRAGFADVAPVVQFVEDDAGYLVWLAANPDGFVVNTHQSPTPSYLILHRATCGTISRDPARGKHWTLDYSKVCGTQPALKQWAADVVGGPVKPCGRCLREGAGG